MQNTKDLIQYESPLGTKTKHLIVRLTAEEKTLLVEQAQKHRLSISALVRLMLAELSKKDLRFK